MFPKCSKLIQNVSKIDSKCFKNWFYFKVSSKIDVNTDLKQNWFWFFFKLQKIVTVCKTWWKLKRQEVKIETRKNKSLPLLFFSHSCLNQHWQQIKPLWYRKKWTGKKKLTRFLKPSGRESYNNAKLFLGHEQVLRFFYWTFISLSYLQKTNLYWISWCFTVQSFFFREVNSSTTPRCERAAAPPIRAHMVSKVPKWKVTHKLHWPVNFGCWIMDRKNAQFWLEQEL